MNSKFSHYLSLILLVLFFMYGCKQKPDLEQYKQEILALHQELINAHLEKDIDFFTRDIADDYMQVQGGEIKYPQKDDIIERFTDYLNNTTFTEYKDLQEPIVGISEDGSLAWIVVQVKIEGSRVRDSIPHELDFTCAWITLYKRVGEKWIRMMEVDNFK